MFTRAPARPRRWASPRRAAAAAVPPPSPEVLPRHPPAGRRRRRAARPRVTAGGTAARSPSPRPPPKGAAAARFMPAARRSWARLARILLVPSSSARRAGPHLPPGRPEAATGSVRCPPGPRCPPRCGLPRRPPSAAARGRGDAREEPRRPRLRCVLAGPRRAETGRLRPGCGSSQPTLPPSEEISACLQTFAVEVSSYLTVLVFTDGETETGELLATDHNPTQPQT